MAKKSNNVKILSPTEYWERKLGVKFEDELIPYKGLCVKKLIRKEEKQLKTRQYKTHAEWATFWVNIFSQLSSDEKDELVFYLENRVRLVNTFDSLSHSLLIPLITSILVSVCIPSLTNYIGSNSTNEPTITLIKLISALILGGCFLCFCIKKCIYIVRNDMLEQHFYSDLKSLLIEIQCL